MNLRTTTEEVAFAAMETMREAYLDALPHAQDALVEALVRDEHTKAWRIAHRSETMGYFLLRQGQLLELFLRPEYEYFAHRLVPRIVHAHEIRSALVKTFDALFLACCLDFAERVEVHGALSRDYLRRTLPNIPRIRYASRIAEPADLARIVDVEQDVFTRVDRLEAAVAAGKVLLFERDDALIGFGLLKPVIAGRPAIELGIAVDQAYRNKGYSIYMLRDMAEACFERGLQPVTGCSRRNEPSIRMGVRIGFVSKYRVIETHFSETSLANGPDWSP